MILIMGYAEPPYILIELYMDNTFPELGVICLRIKIQR